MAGKSADGVTNGAGSLASGGVKIITVGIGGLFDGSQLSTMATLPSYKLSSISFIKLLSISRSTSSLISQGTYIFFATSFQFLERHFLILRNTSAFQILIRGGLTNVLPQCIALLSEKKETLP